MADDSAVNNESYPTIQSPRGIAGSLSRPISWREVRQIAQEERAEDVARSRKSTAD